MSDCLFCKIVAREMDAQIVMETDLTLAFKDINPAAPTHVLVIPKEHVASAHELGKAHDEVLAGLFTVMRRIADEAQLGDGYRIVTNVGSDGGQSVNHLHFHVLGGRSLGWPPG